jgi:hypothetical protein
MAALPEVPRNWRRDKGDGRLGWIWFIDRYLFRSFEFAKYFWATAVNYGENSDILTSLDSLLESNGNCGLSCANEGLE